MITIQEAISRAISIKGYEILLDRRLLCNTLEDLSPDLYESIAFINRIITDAVGELLYKSYLAEKSQRDSYIIEIDRMLEEEEDRGTKSRKLFLSYFEFDINEKTTNDKAKAISVSKKSTQTLFSKPSKEDDSFIIGEIAEQVQKEVAERTSSKESGEYNNKIKQENENQKDVDAVDAFLSLRNAANRGNMTAQYKLGMLFYRIDSWSHLNDKIMLDDNVTYKVDNETIKALTPIRFEISWKADEPLREQRDTWLTKAANQGYPDAQYMLGYLAEKNPMIDGGPNNRVAVKWYRLAAEQGHSEAQCSLGFMYKYGLGVITSKRKAVEWYERAARQGDADGILRRGDLIKSDVKRLSWYETYYENYYLKKGLFNYRDQMHGQKLCFAIGSMYHHGRGCQQNNRTAAEWYRRGFKLRSNFNELWASGSYPDAVFQEVGLNVVNGRLIE